MTSPENPNEYMPSPAAVAAAYGEVLAHNDKHGATSIFRNLMMALVETINDGDTVDAEPAALPEGPAPRDQAPSVIDANVAAAVAEGDMGGDVQGMLHEDLFTRIGLTLAPEGAHYLQTVGDNRATSIELRPTITNTELFHDFLTTLDRQDTAQATMGEKLLVDVARVLRREAVAFNGDAPEGVSDDELHAMRQHGVDLLRTFGKVEDLYTRLGIDTKDTRLLSDYLTYWARGFLAEFIRVGPPEKLAAVKLECMDSELATKEWQAKIEYIRSLIIDDSTREYGLEAAHALHIGLANTIRLIDGNPDEWYATEADRAMFVSMIDQLGHDAAVVWLTTAEPTPQPLQPTGDPVTDALNELLRNMGD